MHMMAGEHPQNYAFAKQWQITVDMVGGRLLLNRNHLCSTSNNQCSSGLLETVNQF
jgi:hypothetical protein